MGTFLDHPLRAPGVVEVGLLLGDFSRPPHLFARVDVLGPRVQDDPSAPARSRRDRISSLRKIRARCISIAFGDRNRCSATSRLLADELRAGDWAVRSAEGAIARPERRPVRRVPT